MTTITAHCPKCGAHGQITKPTSAGTVVFTCTNPACGQATNYHSVAGMLDTFDCPICSKTNLPSTLGSMIDAYKERALVWYDFSEGSGAVLGDKSWSAKDAAITGATWDGNSLHFAGTDHAIAASPAIPATAITKVTVLLKVKCAQNAAWQWFLDNGQSTPNGEISVLRRQAADWLNFRYSNGTIAGAEIKDESFFTGFDNEFVFIAVTADYVTPYAVKFYRNGEGVVYTGNMTTPVASVGARALEIGALTGGTMGIIGDMSLVAIIPEILTAAEIEELFSLITLDAYRERALVWYDFTEGAGNTLRDASNNARNAVIAGAVWDGNGLHFEGGDHAIAASPAIPAGPLTKLTILMKVRCAQNANWMFLLDGVQSISDGSLAVVRRLITDWLAYRYSNGTISGAEIKDESFFTGFDNEFVFIAVTADYVTPFAVKIYRNGEGVVYTANMTTPVAPTGARALEIGALTGGSYGLVGDIALVAIIPEVLTATEIEECFFLNLAAPTGRNVVFEGDSLIANYYDGAEQHWGSNKVEELMVDENYNRYLNVGTGGERLIADILAEGVAQVDASYDSRYANNIAFIWAGLNDLYPGVITAADVLAGLETWCLARRVAGFKTIVCTLHSTPAYTYYEAQRAIVNAALLELPAWLDAVCDSGSDPLLDPDDDTMYQEDGVHLTQLAQETVIAPHMVTAIQSLET